MVRDVAGDRLVALPRREAVSRLVELARELPRRLDGLATTRAEENPVEVAGGEGRDFRGELDRTRVRVRPVRVEGQLPHLLERRLADLLAEAVADVDGEEPRERVEVPLAVDVLEVAAVAADDDRRSLAAAHVREVEPEVVVREAPEVVGGRRALRDAHLVVSSSFGIPLPQS